MTVRPVVKRTARAVLLDGDDLILIKRTKPGVDPYWLTPGGGVEPEPELAPVANIDLRALLRGRFGA